jgi:hypothetical protein
MLIPDFGDACGIAPGEKPANQCWADHTFEQEVPEESEGANKCQVLKQNGKDFWTGFTFAFAEVSAVAEAMALKCCLPVRRRTILPADQTSPFAEKWVTQPQLRKL